MAVLRTEFGTSLGESGSKATAIISEHMGEMEGKGGKVCETVTMEATSRCLVTPE